MWTWSWPSSTTWCGCGWGCSASCCTSPPPATATASTKAARGLVDLRDPRRIGDLLDDTDRDLHDCNLVHKNAIESVARTWTLRNADEALGLVDTWIRAARALVDADTGADDWRHRALGNLRDPITKHRDKALARLCAEADCPKPLVAAAASKAVEILEETFAPLIDGTRLARSPPPTRRWAASW